MTSALPTPEPIRPTELARLELLRLVPDPGQSLFTVLRRACELAARVIRVERVGVWLFVEDRTAIRCVALFERTENEFSEGAILRVADFPTYFAALHLRKAVPAELATADPSTAELAAAYLRPLGITSMLDAGISGIPGSSGWCATNRSARPGSGRPRTGTSPGRWPTCSP